MKPITAFQKIAGISVAIAAISGIGFAQEFQKKLIIYPEITYTPSIPSALSSDATKLLLYVSDARIFIRDKQPEQAKQSIAKALKLITAMKSVKPTEKVENQIRIAENHLAYKVEDEVAQELTYIYYSLNEISGIVPIEKTKYHIDKAKFYLQGKNKEAAKQELREACKTLVYLKADSSLLSAETSINSARNNLMLKKPKMADEALENAEDEIAGYGPLMQARKSYFDSSEKYAAGKLADAREDLKLARNYLQKAFESGDQKIRREAEILSKDINDLWKKIEMDSGRQ